MLRCIRTLLLAAIIASTSAVSADAEQRFGDGDPRYESEDTKTLIEAMVAAHGGLAAWDDVSAMRFEIITKVIGTGQAPTYSIETTNMKTGAAYLDYPFWNAQVAWDTEEVWSQNWPLPLPPGFFTGLTTSFITLPWLTQNEGVALSAPYPGTLPGDETLYRVVRMTVDDPGPTIPGEYYELFINEETKLLAGIGFNITHPFMMRIASQPIGPNYHMFSEYQTVGGLVIPTYYETNGYNAQSGGITRAMHAVFGIDLSSAFDAERLKRPADAVTDESTSEWWAR